MVMTWNEQADARLFMHVLKIHQVKLDYQALANAMGNGCTAKAVTHRIAKLKKEATGDSSPQGDEAAAAPAARSASKGGRGRKAAASNTNGNTNTKATAQKRKRGGKEEVETEGYDDPAAHEGDDVKDEGAEASATEEAINQVPTTAEEDTEEGVAKTELAIKGEMEGVSDDMEVDAQKPKPKKPRQSKKAATTTNGTTAKGRGRAKKAKGNAAAATATPATSAAVTTLASSNEANGETGEAGEDTPGRADALEGAQDDE